MCRIRCVHRFSMLSCCRMFVCVCVSMLLLSLLGSYLNDAIENHLPPHHQTTIRRPSPSSMLSNIHFGLVQSYSASASATRTPTTTTTTTTRAFAAVPFNKTATTATSLTASRIHDDYPHYRNHHHSQQQHQHQHHRQHYHHRLSLNGTGHTIGGTVDINDGISITTDDFDGSAIRCRNTDFTTTLKSISAKTAAAASSSQSTMRPYYPLLPLSVSQQSLPRPLHQHHQPTTNQHAQHQYQYREPHQYRRELHQYNTSHHHDDYHHPHEHPFEFDTIGCDDGNWDGSSGAYSAGGLPLLDGDAYCGATGPTDAATDAGSLSAISTVAATTASLSRNEHRERSSVAAHLTRPIDRIDVAAAVGTATARRQHKHNQLFGK